jgi:uroporphyrinogen decarboxylase
MNTSLVDACFKKKTPYTPVWFMRQAGRYLPEYRKLKGEKNILDMVRNPDLATKIALQPVDILGVDAAILYADIMIPLLGIDVDLEIVENIGPVIRSPLKTLTDVKKLRKLEPEQDIQYLLQTIGILRNELKNKVPLIGFSAAPYTLASYLIEGKPTRDFVKTKSFMYTNSEGWFLLMEKLTEMIIIYLTAQVNSGVQVLQIFDSWVGSLSEEDYITYVLPYSKLIFDAFYNTQVPIIHFGTNTAGLFQSFASVNCNVISIDWRMSLAKAWKVTGYKKAIQGNLDPVLLLQDFSILKKSVDTLFSTLPQKEGFILNLGHGVLPTTPVQNLKRLVEYVHAISNV